MEALVKEVSDFYIDTKSKKVRMNTIILEKQSELAKVALRRETPLIQIIDKPILPLAKERFGKAKGIVVGGFLAGFLVVVGLIGKRILRELS